MNVTYILIAFAAMLGMMLLGLPIAVSMASIGIVGGLLAYGMPFINSIAPVVWGVHNDNLLTAIPLFVLMGELLLRSGIADRMFCALAAWLGRLPGGLLHTNIGCSALFAATSGSSGHPRRDEEAHVGERILLRNPHPCSYLHMSVCVYVCICMFVCSLLLR